MVSPIGDGDRSSRSGSSMAARMGVGLALGALVGLMSTNLGLPQLVSWWRGYASLTIACSALGALLAVTRLRRAMVWATLLLGALWLAVVATPLTLWMTFSLQRLDAIPEGGADVIFVFSSSMQLDGEPTTSAMTRLLRGLELLGEGRAPRLVVSELPPPIPSYQEVARQWMAHLDVRGELLAVGPVRNTHDEALALAALCRSRGWRSVLAVSAPTHLRRAAGALEHEGLTAIAVPAIEPRFDVQSFDRADDRLLGFGAALHDLVGYEVYRLRGWIAR